MVFWQIRVRKLALALAFCLPLIVFLSLTGLTRPVQALPFNQILTNTPMADGAIVHIVQADEALASIAEAYGISLADLRAQNSLAEDSTFISPGQRLIIRLPLPATETPTITPTIPKPTRTPTPLVPTRTPRPTWTDAPTLTPTATPNPALTAMSGFFSEFKRPLLLTMLGVCLLGLAWTIYAGFIAQPPLGGE